MRQIIQLSGPATALVALCDDDSVWCFSTETGAWQQLPPIPGQSAGVDTASAAAEHDRLVLERQERAEQARRDRFERLP